MLNIPSFSMGFIAGFGTGFISREISRTGGLVLRPITKTLVKTGMATMEKSRETFAYFTETLEDLVAEARSEVSQDRVEPAPKGDVVEVNGGRTTGSLSEEPKSRSKGKARAEPNKEQA